jgi:hypothetical protein
MIVLALLFISLILTACGTSPEEQAATVVVQTAAAATSTPTITPFPPFFKFLIKIILEEI